MVNNELVESDTIFTDFSKTVTKVKFLILKSEKFTITC